MGLDPVALREAQDHGPVEPSRGVQVEVLDDRVAAQLGRLETSGQAPVLAVLLLAVDEQAQALLEAELGVLGRAELFLERPGHAAEGEGLELVDGGVDEHGSLLSHS